ncbi:MAG TPA: lysophospholipid acyltransferase family protein [Thermoanaerobaculia bacterium]|nr:lysophospholipid acyltransferase family protein [Thermoanaerobaculia bacterium]
MKNRPVLHRVEYGFYLALKGFLRALPHSGARSFGRGLGSLAHRLDRRHREVALRNMALALPEIPEPERRRLVRACFRHFGAALCDAISSTRFNGMDLCHLFSLEGWEHLDEAESRGQGIFILSAHLGFWELVPPMIGLTRGRMDIVVRPADNPWLDRELRALRERFGNAVIPKRGAARRMIEVLRDPRGRGRVGILIDQRVQEREGIAVPFFGRPALTTPVLARLSLRTGAAVVPVAAYPEPGGRYRIVVRPPILPPPEGEDGDEAVAALTRLYLEAAEEDIREHPEMWLWMHRRWDERRKKEP